MRAVWVEVRRSGWEVLKRDPGLYIILEVFNIF